MAGDADIALLRAHPELSRVPRQALVSIPTPVAPLALDGVPRDGLFVKRDDRSCPLYGGNKPRKLEFILGAARARGARRLVTSGGLATNHGLATTILGRAHGLETTLVLVHQPVTSAVARSLMLQDAYGARLVYGRNVPGVALRTAGVLARSTLRGERPFLVAPGGSSTRGTLGMVSAGLELAEQVRAGALPEPRELYVAVGTGGTLAGLVAGLALAGLATRVVGVLVTNILPPSPARLARDARRVLRWMRRAGARLPALRIAPADFGWVDDQLGSGYGAATPAARDAVAAAAAAGLALETTYTGKCLAAIRERARSGDWPGPVLFWNTYNGVDVEAAAPRRLDVERLPPRFRALLREQEI